MDNRRYAELLDATTSKYGKWNVPRSSFGVGVNSDEATCNAKNMYLIVDSKPIIDTATQKQGSQHIVFDDVAKVWNVTYDVVDIPLDELQAKKVAEIDKATEDSITELVGSDINQRNLTAKSVQLTRKESLGTITAEEQIQLDTLDGLFIQVETLRLSGNDKEAQILACTTQTEFDTKCIELGV